MTRPAVRRRRPTRRREGGPADAARQSHPGVDATIDKKGAPVQAMDDGVVVRVEQDEQASVDAFDIGRCGRYVVLKHSYPNGRVVFTRYAQLGRIAGSGGRPIAVRHQDQSADKMASSARTKSCISSSAP